MGNLMEDNAEVHNRVQDNEYSSHHLAQYTNVANDLRFYADQRFKIFTVFCIASGLFANVAKDQPSVVLGMLGAVLSFLCLAWDLDTARWWGTLITVAKELETIAERNQKMVKAYQKYREQIPRTGVQRLPHPRPSIAVACLYFLGMFGWVLFALYSWWKLSGNSP